jgi:hypothetical protein
MLEREVVFLLDILFRKKFLLPLREGKGGNENLLFNTVCTYVAGRPSNYRYYNLLKRYFYCSLLIIAYCVSVLHLSIFF